MKDRVEIDGEMFVREEVVAKENEDIPRIQIIHGVVVRRPANSNLNFYDVFVDNERVSYYLNKGDAIDDLIKQGKKCGLIVDNSKAVEPLKKTHENQVAVLEARIEKLKAENDDLAETVESSIPPVVVWVKYEKDKAMGAWWYCDSDGTCEFRHDCAYGSRKENLSYTKLEAHVIKHFREKYGLTCEIEVCVWKPIEIPYDPVRKTLADIYDRAKLDRISGYRASMIKWDELIDWCEKAKKIPPKKGYGEGFGYWNSHCGLCIEYASNCYKCPLEPCRDGRFMTALNNITDPAEWLEKAKSFRAYIKEQCEPQVKKESEHRWVYGVWATPESKYVDYAFFTNNGADWLNGTGSSESPEKALEHGYNTITNYPGTGSQHRPREREGDPIFGVRRLMEREAKQWGNSSFYKLDSHNICGAFCNGKFIVGSELFICSDQSGYADCVYWIIKQLTPAKSAVMLTDLEVAK